MIAMVKESHKSLQLSSLEAPLSYDYSFARALSLVATSSSIQLYNHRLEATDVAEHNQSIPGIRDCSPSKITFFEGGVNSSLRRAQFQHTLLDNSQLLVSTISSKGLVAIWDLNQSVKPVCDYVHGLGCVDVQWSPHASHLLACSLDSGQHVALVDLRTPSNKTQPILTVYRPGFSASSNSSFISYLQWCPSVEYSNYLAGKQQRADPSGKSSVIVWDIRKSSSPLTEQLIEPVSGGASAFCWSTRDCNQAMMPSIIVGATTGDIEEWKAANSESNQLAFAYSSNLFSSPKKASMILSDNSDNPTIVYSYWYTMTTANNNGGNKRKWTIKAANNRNVTTLLESVSNVIGIKFINAGNSSKVLVLTADSQLHLMSILNKNETNEEVSIPATTTATIKGVSKYSIASIRKVSPEELDKRMSFARSVAMMSVSTAPVKPEVVGPITFQNLIDCSTLNAYILHYDGLKLVQFDQFSRRITLQMLVPAIDSYSLTRGSNSYSTVLSSTTHHKPIDLVICFPIKFVNFWNPKFTVDNRSGMEVSLKYL